ncbi:hypothetical protein HPB48_011663 [Haemaphysalis longicornis]|uniref:Secreted protein n=1 Tax=Haemaphysalis longicornis TaxID=44386 RepID=A0A9J6FP27_HAELO|nr:hypothetical protein HPB48_011663 [Haemaphysalis longicornis]
MVKRRLECAHVLLTGLLATAGHGWQVDVVRRRAPGVGAKDAVVMDAEPERRSQVEEQGDAAENGHQEQHSLEVLVHVPVRLQDDCIDSVDGLHLV